MLIVFFFILIMFSAFFSGSETAILSLNLYRVRSDAEDGNKAAIRLKSYLENPENFLSAVLLGNTLSNIAAASIFTLWLSQFDSEATILAGTIGLTLFILLFCEMLPKSIAARHSYGFSKTVLPLLGFFEILMYPVLKPLSWFASLYLRPAKDKLSDHDMRRIVRTASQQLPLKERVMLEGVLSICTASVENLMIPIHMVETVQPNHIGMNPSTKKTTQSILVAENAQADAILGILTPHDRQRLQAKPSREELLKCLTPPHYILEGSIVSSQLESFQAQRNRVSIIIDEYGTPLGLLDLGDILDELLGHYAKSDDYPLGQIKQSPSGSIWVKSQTRIREINQRFDMSLPTDRAQTIGGLLIDELQCIPDGSCSLVLCNRRFDILDVKNNQIEWIEIHPTQLLTPHD